MVSIISKVGQLISKFNSTWKITPLVRIQVCMSKNKEVNDIKNRSDFIKIWFDIRNYTSGPNYMSVCQKASTKVGEMVSKISITAQLTPKFNYAHETSGSPVCLKIY
jgi:hypothetical protein